MAQKDFSAELTDMIEQIKTMTADQAMRLGSAWNSEEGLSFDPANLNLELSGYAFLHEIPTIQNLALEHTWRHVSDVATDHGRADELDAAIAAEKAAEHSAHHLKVEAPTRSGVVEASRAAVLAVGVRDIIAPTAYELLVGPWETTFGKK